VYVNVANEKAENRAHCSTAHKELDAMNNQNSLNERYAERGFAANKLA
jgi:hypothetical protein